MPHLWPFSTVQKRGARNRGGNRECRFVRYVGLHKIDIRLERQTTGCAVLFFLLLLVLLSSPLFADVRSENSGNYRHLGLVWSCNLDECNLLMSGSLQFPRHFVGLSSSAVLLAVAPHSDFRCSRFYVPASSPVRFLPSCSVHLSFVRRARWARSQWTCRPCYPSTLEDRQGRRPKR